MRSERWSEERAMSRPEQIRRHTGRQSAAGRQALLLALCALAAAAIAVGLWREAANPLFAVEVVAVLGLEHTPTAEVVAAAGLPPGQNAWLIDRRKIARRIEALPWVRSAALHVGWPNKLVISVSERRPVALCLCARA